MFPNALLASPNALPAHCMHFFPEILSRTRTHTDAHTHTHIRAYRLRAALRTLPNAARRRRFDKECLCFTSFTTTFTLCFLLHAHTHTHTHTHAQTHTQDFIAKHTAISAADAEKQATRLTGMLAKVIDATRTSRCRDCCCTTRVGTHTRYLPTHTCAHSR
jgi:hypothetical protein